MNTNFKHSPVLPDDYVKIIAVANGIYYNSAQLYGLNPSLGIIQDLYVILLL